MAMLHCAHLPTVRHLDIRNCMILLVHVNSTFVTVMAVAAFQQPANVVGGVQHEHETPAVLSLDLWQVPVGNQPPKPEKSFKNKLNKAVHLCSRHRQRQLFEQSL
jgi:hypothetical protein